MKKPIKQDVLQGTYVNLREVELTDAAFILTLRTDERKSRFIHKTENNLEKQIEYLERYKQLDNEYYFIVERKDGQLIGTERLYDIRENSCILGSWLMVDGASAAEVLEGDILLKNFAFLYLGMREIRFDVRKGNKRVIRYHINWGSELISENEIDYFFCLKKEVFTKNQVKFLGLLNMISL